MVIGVMIVVVVTESLQSSLVERCSSLDESGKLLVCMFVCYVSPLYDSSGIIWRL